MDKIKGKKLNMSQVFGDNGKVVPVTLIECESEIPENIEGREVVIVGYSKGKGFTGVMKKWGFHGGPATRGQGRTPGSIGSQTPGRVLRGKKMAGRQGNARITIKGLKIVKINKDLKQLFVSGPIPGARNSAISISVLGENK